MDVTLHRVRWPSGRPVDLRSFVLGSPPHADIAKVTLMILAILVTTRWNWTWFCCSCMEPETFAAQICGLIFSICQSLVQASVFRTGLPDWREFFPLSQQINVFPLRRKALQCSLRLNNILYNIRIYMLQYIFAERCRLD